MPKDNYINIRECKDSSYSGEINLPNGYGHAHMGSDLDECIEKIIEEAKESGVKEVRIKSYILNDDFSEKAPLSTDDLELLVFCLNEECPNIKFS